MEKTFEKTAYVICHNGKDIIHPSKVEKGTTLASGQPEFEEFSDETAWKERLTELGYDVSSLEPSALRDPASLKLGKLNDLRRNRKEKA
jgi:hypothetical protein